MTFVKICGITNLDDAITSVKFGADALGFNFYEKSPRYIAPKAAQKIVAQLPDPVLKFGVFVNDTVENIVRIAGQSKLDAIQLHGDETPEFVETVQEQLELIVIKAFRVSARFNADEVLKFKADAILLDAYSRKDFGGTGKVSDWKIAKQVKDLVNEMYLAGGLSLENVVEAIRTVEPFAVDACSLLEKSPGIKDHNKLQQFIANAKGKE